MNLAHARSANRASLLWNAESADGQYRRRLGLVFFPHRKTRETRESESEFVIVIRLSYQVPYNNSDGNVNPHCYVTCKVPQNSM
jgi:hypothetical protein